MDLKLILNYLILSEDNINVELVNWISNFQLGSIFNTEPNKSNKTNLNNKKSKRNKKSN